MEMIIFDVWLRTQIWSKWFSQFYSKIGPKMGSDDSACISRKINGLLIKTAVMVGSAPNSVFTDLFGRILIVLNCKKSTILMIYSLSDPVSLLKFFVFDWSLFLFPFIAANMLCRHEYRVRKYPAEHGWELHPKPKYLVTFQAYLSVTFGPNISGFLDLCLKFTVQPKQIWIKLNGWWQILPQHQSIYFNGPESASIEVPCFGPKFT